VISFIDIYKKVECNFPGTGEVTEADRLRIGKEFIRIAAKYDMTIRPCAEGNELEPYGADCAGCMTVKTFETALHSYLAVPKRKSNQRGRQCVCLPSTGIGAYDTCGHLCKYCYVNTNAALVKENKKKHNLEPPFLPGGSMPGKVIHEAVQKSWINRQMRFDFE